jgi:hypothetical protein
MSSNCNYSFADLYRAAFGRAAEPHELAALYALSRAEINATVREWAQRAGWRTRELRGTDGETYLAFWPEEPI